MMPSRAKVAVNTIIIAKTLLMIPFTSVRLNIT